MRPQYSLAILVLSVTASPAALAQDNMCSVLLQHGMFDTYRQQSGAVNASQFHTYVCEAYT